MGVPQSRAGRRKTIPWSDTVFGPLMQADALLEIVEALVPRACLAHRSLKPEAILLTRQALNALREARAAVARIIAEPDEIREVTRIMNAAQRKRKRRSR